MENKLEQYSKRSEENRGKDSEQTITSTKEKKEVNRNCYPFSQYLQIALNVLVLSSDFSVINTGHS